MSAAVPFSVQLCRWGVVLLSDREVKDTVLFEEVTKFLVPTSLQRS